MDYLFAPMEGITLAQYRKLHHKMFPGTAEYYTPFIAPDSRGSFKSKYLSELMTDRGEVNVIPQLLVNNAEAFNATAKQMYALGFSVINLNAGCPSGTVYSKHKGAGMLADPDTLDRILDEIFDCAEKNGYRISIKTRMGVHSTEEFSKLLNVYNRYPIEKLIVHARARDGYYKSTPDMAGFSEAVSRSRAELCYNGDIHSEDDLKKLKKSAPEVDKIMIGRGVVANPALIRVLQGGPQLQIDELRIFHDTLLKTWLESGLSPNFTVERMKTLWSYMEVLFSNGKREKKAIMKARGLDQYLEAVSILMNSGVFDPQQKANLEREEDRQ